MSAHALVFGAHVLLFYNQNRTIVIGNFMRDGREYSYEDQRYCIIGVRVGINL